MVLTRAGENEYMTVFILNNGGDPNCISTDSVELMIVKYVLQNNLKDPSNPAVAWTDVRLNNVLGGVTCYHYSQLTALVQNIMKPKTVTTSPGLSLANTVFAQWKHNGNSFMVSETLRQLMVRDFYHVFQHRSEFTLQELKFYCRWILERNKHHLVLSSNQEMFLTYNHELGRTLQVTSFHISQLPSLVHRMICPSTPPPVFIIPHKEARPVLLGTASKTGKNKKRPRKTLISIFQLTFFFRNY